MSLKEGFKKASKEVSGRLDYMRGDKGILEKKYQQTKKYIPEGGIGEIRRIATLGGIDLAWFLFCLGKYTAKDLHTVFIDNAIINKFKEKNRNIKIKDSDSEFKQFFKKLQKSHPHAAARLKLWMLYSLFVTLTVGGIKIGQHNRDDDKNAETELVLEDEQQSHTFADFKKNLEPITPWLIAQLISAEGVKLDADGLHKPYKDGNGIWTICFGSTRLKDGTAVTENTPHMTNEEAYELARWHLEDKETFFILYCYGVYDNKLLPKNTGEAFALASIVYNSATKFIEDENDENCRERFALLRQKYKEYGDEISDSIVLDIFQKYPIQNKKAFGKAWIDSHDPNLMAKAIGEYMKDGSGMHWRRWLEAGLITGDITPEDLLDCPIGGMSDFYLYMGGYQKYQKTKHETLAVAKSKELEIKKSSLWVKTSDGWIPKKSTYNDFKEWLTNPKTKEKGSGIESVIVRKKVKDFLPEDILRKCMNGKCEVISFDRCDNNKTVSLVQGIKNIKNKQNEDGNKMIYKTRELS